MMGVPVRLHATPGRAVSAPPRLGQHTDQVLGKILGFRRSEIARLRRNGVV
jgi:formyl-CoA transferase